MEASVKYQFDKEMVGFVKQLEIKTAMFGYDKKDVYSKFKDLLVRARDVCERLVQEEREKAMDLGSFLKEEGDASALGETISESSVSDATCAASESGESSDSEPAVSGTSDISEDEHTEDADASVRMTTLNAGAADIDHAESEELPAIEEWKERADETPCEPSVETLPLNSEFPESVDRNTEDSVECGRLLPEQDSGNASQISGLMERINVLESEKEDLSEQLQKKMGELEDVLRELCESKEEGQTLTSKIGALSAEKAMLEEKLNAYAEREEALNHTDAILEEARHEGENIVRESRIRAEQELFLYRARCREEERAHESRISGLQKEKKSLEQQCCEYRDYIAEGKSLMETLSAYSSRFDFQVGGKVKESETPPVCSDSQTRIYPASSSFSSAPAAPAVPDEAVQEE